MQNQPNVPQSESPTNVMPFSSACSTELLTWSQRFTEESQDDIAEYYRWKADTPFKFGISKELR